MLFFATLVLANQRHNLLLLTISRCFSSEEQLPTINDADREREGTEHVPQNSVRLLEIFEIVFFG